MITVNYTNLIDTPFLNLINVNDRYLEITCENNIIRPTMLYGSNSFTFTVGDMGFYYKAKENSINCTVYTLFSYKMNSEYFPITSTSGIVSIDGPTQIPIKPTITIGTISRTSLTINYTLPSSPSYETITKLFLYYQSYDSKLCDNPVAQTGSIILSGLAPSVEYNIYIVAVYTSSTYSKSIGISAITAA